MNSRLIITTYRYRLFSTCSKCCSKNETRVRFAPSPTGNIHLGGLRTALYNYIFARKHGGKFILRIEDTDQTRIVDKSAKDIEDVLNWAGLEPDESPTLGGPYGPYSQSERLRLYKQRAQQLIKSGKAYKCFCSPERLDLLRKYQSRNREKPRYDGKCKNLSDTAIEEKMAETNGRYVIRFAIEPKITKFTDLVHGDITNDYSKTKESDPVLMKSDNFPTYHFANVVDDHEMKISHVLRGSEWISSTAKHIQLYQAFNWDAPKFAHFPLITLKGGSKMSKRNNESQVRSWIESGYKPLAILNFLTNMGGGLPKGKQDSMDLWDLSKIVEEFNFDKILCNPGSIDMEKLKIYNMKDLQKSWTDDPKTVLKEVKGLLARNNIISDLDDENLYTIVEQFVPRLITLNDLISLENSFIWKTPSFSWTLEEYHEKAWDLRNIVQSIISVVQETNFEERVSLNAKFKDLSIKHGIDLPSLLRFIRKLLTNNDSGPPVNDIFKCLGKRRSLEYLDKGLKYIN